MAILHTIEAEEGFYCRTKSEKYRICRRCPEIDDACPNDPDGCYCQNIQLWDKTLKKFVGGSDCEDNFCFLSYNKVYEDESCSDVDYESDSEDALATRLKLEDNSLKFWHHLENDIIRSESACDNKKKIKTGNEKMLQGVQIISDFLDEVKAETENGISTLSEDKFSFYANNEEECMEECQSLCGKCGAWSYDKENENCFLHTVDACCGQKKKQVKRSSFVSGYYCNHCWSSIDDSFCDSKCSLKDRLKPYPDACEGVGEESAGAVSSQFTSSATESRIETIKLNEDPCACEWRLFPKKNRCRCVKPTCKDKEKNPYGKCVNRRRCLRRKLDDIRNPPCDPNA